MNLTILASAIPEISFGVGQPHSQRGPTADLLERPCFKLQKTGLGSFAYFIANVVYKFARFKTTCILCGNTEAQVASRFLIQQACGLRVSRAD